MLKSIKKIFLVFLLVTGCSLIASPVSAQTKDWADLQAEDKFTQGRDYGCLYVENGTVTDVATIRGIECIIANVLSIIITLIGLAGFVMMIFAAFKYQLGGSKGAESARNIITYAVIGLVLALSSYFILNILANFTGVSLITSFEIPQIDANP